MTKQVLLYRYHLITSILMIISGNVKGLKKSIVGVTANQFPSLLEYDTRIEEEMAAIRQNDPFDSTQLVLSQYAQNNSFFVNHQLLKSYLEFNRGNYQKIVSFCCNGSPDDVTRLSLLGSSQFALGHFSLALLYYQQILHIHPAFDRSLYGGLYRNLGILHYALGDFAAARGCLQRALSCLPQNAWFWFYYTEVLAKSLPRHASREHLGELQMALRTALQLKATEELHLDCLTRLAWAKLQLADFAGVCALCDQVEAIAKGCVPRCQRVHLFRAEAHVGCGEVKKALEEVDPETQPLLYPEWIVRAVKEKKVGEAVQYSADSLCEAMLVDSVVVGLVNGVEA